MPVSPGTRVGPYEILSLLGAGGMGEVYQARDTRLARDVAIKLSAERFSDRFEREARAVAALNHPNICTLYDVGPNYLVMELIEGLTLAGRIGQGALPFEEAHSIAGQIAAALEAAHEKGIVHRDLKPANIKIKPDGTVKVLDFGLAKMSDSAVPAAGAEFSPTLTLEQATRVGVVLGTAGYMAPEQARGKTVDKRADIWAFGVVFYEMLTGRRLFQGETVSDTLASVLKEEPRWAPIPARAQRMLQRCLEKDPQRRLRDIGDALPLLEDTLVPTAAPSARRPWLSTAAAAVALAAALALGWVHFRERPATPGTLRFQIPYPENIIPAPAGNFALSPNGRRLVYSASDTQRFARLWVRNMDTLESHPLPGTESSAGHPPIFWSPDSQFVAFWDGQRLKKIDVTEGPPQTICDAPLPVIGGTWNADGIILFSASPGGLLRVSAGGGIPVPATALDFSKGEVTDLLPDFLSDGRRFLFLRVTRGDYGIYVTSLDAKPGDPPLRRLLTTTHQARFVPGNLSNGGHIIFERDGTLLAQKFDPGRLELAGEPVAIAERLGSFSSFSFFSVSDTGMLVYRTGSGQTLRATWVDRQGKILSTAGDAAFYSTVSLAPDNSRAALVNRNSQDIWLLDFSRGTNTRFTLASEPGPADYPVWSPDGQQIVFAAFHGRAMDLYQKPASGAQDGKVLLHSERNKFPFSWTRDGRFLLYAVEDPKTGTDLWILPMQGERKPVPFLVTPFREEDARFSPDGRWVAYTSNESGPTEVYVREFLRGSDGVPVAGGKWLVSRGGGQAPRWRGDGKELFYLGLGGTVVAVDVTPGPSFQAGVPRVLFPKSTLSGWDVASDGKRMLFALEEENGPPAPFTVVSNWQSALK